MKTTGRSTRGFHAPAGPRPLAGPVMGPRGAPTEALPPASATTPSAAGVVGLVPFKEVLATDPSTSLSS